MNKYESLFSNCQIGQLNLPNRIVMPAMGNGLAREGYVTDGVIDYYGARAKGGVGLVMVGCTTVSADSTRLMLLSIHDDMFVSGIKKLVDAIHEQGAKIGIQGVHFGTQFPITGPMLPGMSVKVPSMTPLLPEGIPYQELGEHEIEGYIRDYAASACRVKEAGADVFELHACHGCLISSFLSPVTNRRTDRYGGNVENRARFAREVVIAIREAVGPNFPLIVRINGTDDLVGGVTEDEVVQYAVILKSAGIDAISVSAGLELWTTLTIPCYAAPEGPTLSVAEKVRTATGLPVVAVGKIGPELGQRLIKDKKVDLIAMGRALLADSDLPNKLTEGRIEDIRECIRCNNCLRPEAGSMSCSVNPFLYRESEIPLPETKLPKRVMVTGGGPAGMRVASLLAMRGHSVSLYERDQELGGQWNIVSAMPGKEGYVSLTAALRQSLIEHGVEIKLGTEVTKELVLQEKPDVVVVANGARPKQLNIPIYGQSTVIQANEVFQKKVTVKGRIVVIGAGSLALETAISLAEEGKEVSLITRGSLGGSKGAGDSMTFRTLVRKLIELRIPTYINSTVLEIIDGSVMVRMEKDVFPVKADMVILAVGVESVNQLYLELQGVISEVYSIGDCVEPRHIAAATLDAAKLAARI